MFIRERMIWTGGIIVLLVCFALSVFMGNGAVRSASLFRAAFGGAGASSDGAALLILRQVRLPRAFAALVCGAGLAVSGLLLQTAMDNVLAAPGVLGINAGAGCFSLVGALVFPYLPAARQGFAFFGALVAAALVFLISRGAGVTKTTLILAGVAVSSLFNAVISWIITLRPESVTDKVAFQLGGLQAVTGGQLWLTAPVILAGVGAAFLLAGSMDLFALGDEAAGGVGLNVRACRLGVLLIATVLAAAAVGVCGLISFIGLIVPNLLRLADLRGARRQIAACALWGGGFLLLCDLIARRLFFPYELPVGLILSFLGTPFFIWMLVKKKRRLSV